MAEAEMLMADLDRCCGWSGQLINFSKSSIHFSNNVSRGLRRRVCHLLGMKECDHKGTYLGLPFCTSSSSISAHQPLFDKLKRKLGGWKTKVLSQAGRSVLVKSVALAIPAYCMQTMFLPKSVCSKLDGLMRDFWWGFREGDKHHLYLTAWTKICTPKQAGGLGFRLCSEMNAVAMTKLAWEISSRPEKLWVRLIRAKYLRGRQLLDYQLTRSDASRLWKGVVTNLDKLKSGCCYRVGNPTHLRIWDDPWIPTLPSFRPPIEYKRPNGPLYVHQLFSSSSYCWDVSLLSMVFPYPIIKEILKINLPPHLEQDRLIWLPSPTGEFSTKSAYRAFSQARFSLNSDLLRGVWRNLWSSDLHPRHKHFMWKVLTGILPTSMRLANVIPVSERTCQLCGLEDETSDHLFLFCPFTIALWLHSPWQLRIDRSNATTISTWIIALCSNSLAGPVPLSIRKEVLNHAAVGMDMTWWLRNRIRLGETSPPWPQVFAQISRLAKAYWKAGLLRRSKRTQINKPCRWLPPPLGWVKINFDAAYSDGLAHPAVLVRDSTSAILTAWVSEEHIDGPYAVEARAAEMAFKQGELINSDTIIIEGDALNVIQNITQATPLSDWRGQRYIEGCQNILARRPSWKILYTPNRCNKAAHNLAAWATHSPYCGFVSPNILPPYVLFCYVDSLDGCTIPAAMADDESNG